MWSFKDPHYFWWGSWGVRDIEKIEIISDVPLLSIGKSEGKFQSRGGVYNQVMVKVVPWLDNLATKLAFRVMW